MRRQLLSSEEHNRASGDLTGISADTTLEAAALEFTKVNDYTTFRAEFTVKNESNLVFHFYATPEVNLQKQPWHYWKTVFPRVLEEVAVPFFRSSPPDLRAAFTEELASWWLQADGAAGKVLSADHFARKFLERLDEELEKRI